jgi:hypothetical protein
MRNEQNDLEKKEFNKALYCYFNDISYYVAVNLEKPYAEGKVIGFKIWSFTVLTLKASTSMKYLTWLNAGVILVLGRYYSHIMTVLLKRLFVQCIRDFKLVYECKQTLHYVQIWNADRC